MPLSIVPDRVKFALADIMALVEFGSGGSCVPRAAISHALFRSLGMPSRLVCGGLLYRCGPDPIRDTLRFCGPDINKGCIFEGQFLGHAWIELGHDIIDFSLVDWRADATRHHDSMAHRLDKLGRPQWVAYDVPEFVWQPAKELKKLTRTHGVPEFGQPPWYCGWRGHREPNWAGQQHLVDAAMTHLAGAIETVRYLMTEVSEPKARAA